MNLAAAVWNNNVFLANAFSSRNHPICARFKFKTCLKTSETLPNYWHTILLQLIDLLKLTFKHEKLYCSKNAIMILEIFFKKRLCLYLISF